MASFLRSTEDNSTRFSRPARLQLSFQYGRPRLFTVSPPALVLGRRNIMTWFRSHLADRIRTFLAGEDQLQRTRWLHATGLLSSSRTLKPWQNLLLNAESVTVCLLSTSSCIVYTLVPTDEIHVARQHPTSYISVLWDWCACQQLQLNAPKTVLIWFGTYRPSLRRLSSTDHT